MKTMTRLIGAALAALMPALAAGQITTLAEKISNTGGPTTLDQPASSLGGAEVVAAKGASSASVKVSHILSRGAEDARGFLTFSTWSLTASSPLNKNADDTDIATLDGLSNAGTLEFTISSFRAPGKRGKAPKDKKHVPKLNEICARLHEATKTLSTPVGQSDCTVEEVRQYGSATELHEFYSQLWEPDPKQSDWIWGLSAKFGQQNFDYVEAATAAKAKQDEAPWSLGAFFSLKREEWGAGGTASFRYQRAFKEGANGAVCPAGTGATVTCATGPVGAPKEVTKKLLSLEGRKSFGRVGVGVNTTYDLEGKVWGVELPVHFVKDKEDNLIAGVKLGWRDDTEVFTGTVFVGTKFGLVKY